MPKVIGFDPVDLGFGGMINYSGSDNNIVLDDIRDGNYPTMAISGMNLVAAQLTRTAADNSGLSGFYSIIDAARDTDTGASGYGPENFSHRAAIATGSATMSETWDAGAGRYIELADLTVTVSGTVKTDPLRIEISNNTTVWETVAVYTEAQVDATGSTATIPMTGTARYVRITVYPYNDHASTNYARLFFARTANPWDIKLHTGEPPIAINGPDGLPLIVKKIIMRTVPGTTGGYDTGSLDDVTVYNSANSPIPLSAVTVTASSSFSSTYLPSTGYYGGGASGWLGGNGDNTAEYIITLNTAQQINNLTYRGSFFDGADRGAAHVIEFYDSNNLLLKSVYKDRSPNRTPIITVNTTDTGEVYGDSNIPYYFVKKITFETIPGTTGDYNTGCLDIITVKDRDGNIIPSAAVVCTATSSFNAGYGPQNAWYGVGNSEGQGWLGSSNDDDAVFTATFNDPEYLTSFSFRGGTWNTLNRGADYRIKLYDEFDNMVHTEYKTRNPSRLVEQFVSTATT